MFKLTSTHLVSALAMLCLASVSSAAAIKARGTEASVNVEVCTGPIGTGCVEIPVGSDDCVNLNGGFVFLNKEISNAVIPDGLICTFFESFGCISQQGGGDDVVLTAGTWNLFSAPGTSQPTVNFNDLTSSFSCSAI